DPHPLHSFPTRRSSDLLGVTVSVMSERGGERKPPQRWGAARYTAAAARVIASNSRATVGRARTRSTQARKLLCPSLGTTPKVDRSEEHTSELQSLAYLV